MKKRTFQINIPEPCNESWDKMTPQEQGRFCGKCEKIIIDYSLQPDRVIAKAIKENDNQICGRFRPDQLQRDFMFEPQFYQNTRWKAFGLMISGLLATGNLEAQEQVNLSTHTELTVTNDKNTQAFQNKIIISGKVLSNDTKEALVAATILLKGSTIGCSTDKNGAFRLEISTEKSHLIKNELIIEISYLGYQSQEIIVKKEVLQNSLLVNLEEIYLSNEGIDIPTLEFVGVSSSFIESCSISGKFIVTEETVSQKSREDQTLYQWIKDKVIAARKKRAQKKLLAIENQNKAANESNETTIISIENTEKKTSSQEVNPVSITSKIIQKTYPNPFEDKIIVELKTDKSETYSLVIFNELGQELQRKEVETVVGFNQFSISINEQKYASGVYLLSILSKNQVVQTEIIIKK